MPPALAGTAAGDVFGRLVRMHDRDDRVPVRDAVALVLESLEPERVAEAVRTSAADVARIGAHSGAFVDRWVADVPLGAVANLIGVDAVDLPAAVEAGRTVAASFGPVPPEDAAARAEGAVDVLAGLVSGASSRSGLAAELRRALPADRADEALANVIGLLFQTAAATAGLCANTLARLAGGPTPPMDELPAVVADVSLTDPAVHNTRRWFAVPADIGGVRVAAGDAVLVVLAAANRDPAGRGSLSFGAGAHRCPAAMMAPRIAALTVGALLDEWPSVLTDVSATGFRPLPNVRIATFGRARQPGPGPFGNASS